MNRAARITLLGTATLLGCASEVGVVGAPAIYGEDSRVELEAYPDGTLREIGRASVFAMSRANWFDEWHLCDPENLVSSARTHGEFDELCPEVRFADQLAIADCSATLIDDDLVLTANHCVVDEEACARTRFIGSVYLEPGGALHRITRDDVYHCAGWVASPVGRDMVILQLDRPVAAPYRPAVVSSRPVALGDPLAVVGFPAGLPMKVAADCSVLRFPASGATFRSNCDVFGGNSGSGVFDASGEIVGVMTLGAGSYRPDLMRGGCRTLTEYDLEGRLLSAPGAAPQLSEAEMMASAITTLCESGWPTPLCGTAAVCGDGRCTGRETNATCAADCAAPSCGDGRCSPGEDYTCVEDCGERDSAECMPPADAGVDGGVEDAGVDAGLVSDDASVNRVDASFATDTGSAAPDGGSVTPPSAPSGCACAVHTSSGSSALPWMVVLALWTIRRRRAAL